jgi:hypothetical protein
MRYLPSNNSVLSNSKLTAAWIAVKKSQELAEFFRSEPGIVNDSGHCISVYRIVSPNRDNPSFLRHNNVPAALAHDPEPAFSRRIDILDDTRWRQTTSTAYPVARASEISAAKLSTRALHFSG